MKNIITAVGVGALVLAGCAGDTTEPTSASEAIKPGTGDIDFNLVLSDGSFANSLTLDIACPGINQTHVIDASAYLGDSAIVAAFGGLPAGNDCTVDISSTTSTGAQCSGSTTFPVLDGVSSPVEVMVSCGGGSGANTDEFGGATVRTTLSINPVDCSADRLNKIYAIPAEVAAGSSTVVEVEAVNLAGTAAISFSVDASSTASATFTNQSMGCNPGVASTGPGTPAQPASEDCVTVTCQGTGSLVLNVDLVDSYSASGGETATCSDSEQLVLNCVAPSVPTCGDGVINQPSEQCDGLDGVGPNQSCSATCMLINNPVCGDDMINQASEQCDGVDTPAGQTCGAPGTVNQCQIIPTCGNDIREGAEECDGTDVVAGRTCEADCTLTPVADPCLACIKVDPATEPYYTDYCSEGVDDLCYDSLECMAEARCYSPVPSDCYCGAGVDAGTCSRSSYVRAGLCAAEIRTAAAYNVITMTTDMPSNQDVLLRFFDSTNYSQGWAGVIMDEAFLSSANCPAVCQ